MVASKETTTPLGQRILLWSIALLMLIGTIGSFVVMVIANDNQQKEQARLNVLQQEYQGKAAAQQKELSEKYYPLLSAHAGRVSAFNKESVTKLTTFDIVEGDGENLTSESTFTAYYIGWNPDGKIFDQSINGSALKDPFTAYPGGVIEGWTEGVDGMKVGGIRELTIPADKAYGETGSGELIPANTPLKFIMMVIPTPEAIEPSEELIELYTRLNGGA